MTPTPEPSTPSTVDPAVVAQQIADALKRYRGDDAARELAEKWMAAVPHPTRTVTARVTCVLVDDDGYEITVEHTTGPARYDRSSWRFQVADAEPYPVGSMITLEVPR